MNIAVYCSAKDQIPDDYLRLGEDFGVWLAEEHHTLVYGGATGGLMTRVSDAAKRGGAAVVGVIPECIIQAHRQAHNCDTLYVVQTMAERKQKMRQLADCFVCFPGSFGTLDEMMDVLASGTVGEHRKPLLVLNYNGFYDKLKELMEHMRALHFLPQQESYKAEFINELSEIKNRITNLK